MNQWIAKTRRGAEELHVILVEEVYSDEDHPFTLFVHRDHFSKDRQEIERRYFWSRDEAEEYAVERWGVNPGSWTDRILHRAEFSFGYEFTKLGVPVPVPVGFERTARVVIRRNERSLPDGGSEAVVDIAGTAGGLRYLAALLVLAAESARWDDNFHEHLEWDDRIDTNIAVTVRGPSFADALASRRFQEGTSGPIARGEQEGNASTGDTSA